MVLKHLYKSGFALNVQYTAKCTVVTDMKYIYSNTTLAKFIRVFPIHMTLYFCWILNHNGA